MNRIMPENQPGDLSLQQSLSVIESLFLFRILSVFCLLVFSTAVFAVEPYEGTWRGKTSQGGDTQVVVAGKNLILKLNYDYRFVGIIGGSGGHSIHITNGTLEGDTTESIFYFAGPNFAHFNSTDDKWEGRFLDSLHSFTWEALRVPSIAITPESFGATKEVSSLTFEVTNNGSDALSISNFAIIGTDTTDFVVQNNTCKSEPMNTFDTCTLDVEFQPTTPGFKKATLEITSNDPQTPTLNIPLSGGKIVPTLPDLGVSTSIDKDGHFGSPKTTFKGGSAIAGEEFIPSRVVAPQQPLNIAATIEVATTDIGKTADILFVMGTEPPDSSPDKGYNGGIDTTYTTINSNNQATRVDLYAAADVWMAQLTEPFKAGITLEATLPLTLWTEQSLTAPGMYYFFVGYRLEDGTIVYNSRPIMVEVQ